MRVGSRGLEAPACLAFGSVPPVAPLLALPEWEGGHARTSRVLVVAATRGRLPGRSALRLAARGVPSPGAAPSCSACSEGAAQERPACRIGSRRVGGSPLWRLPPTGRRGERSTRGSVPAVMRRGPCPGGFASGLRTPTRGRASPPYPVSRCGGEVPPSGPPQGTDEGGRARRSVCSLARLVRSPVSASSSSHGE